MAPRAGKYTINLNGDGATSCSLCARGTFKPANATDNKCQRCGPQPVGCRRAHLPRQLALAPSCLAPVSSFPRPASLLVICSCPSGYATLKAEGADSCTACPKGQYAPAPNSISCTACEPGKYTDQPGSKSCKLCAAGYVSTTAASLPAQGQAGWLGDAKATGCTQCAPCPRRTFRPSIYAANTCTQCPSGRETRLERGASTCTACIPGTTLLTNAATSQLDVNCTACPAGRYAEKPGGSGTCAACPAGTAVSDTGNQL